MRGQRRPQDGIGATRIPQSGEHGENPPFDRSEDGGRLAIKTLLQAISCFTAFQLLISGSLIEASLLLSYAAPLRTLEKPLPA